MTGSNTSISFDEYSADDIKRSVARGQAGAINDMTASGLLSDSGPITEQDVGTLIFMAISAKEILDQLEP